MTRKTKNKNIWNFPIAYPIKGGIGAENGRQRLQFAYPIKGGIGAEIGRERLQFAVALTEIGMGEVKVLGAWLSPFVMRPTIALNIKSVPYEFLEETFGSKSELLLKSNPVYKKIPVLIHNDRPISESMIIVQYIDETWTDGPSILPSDPYDRAIARFWATYIDDKVFHYFLLTHHFLLPLVLSIALLGVYKGRNMGGGVGGRKKKKKKK
ncbi:hypothetical protein ACLOJK_028588 [Asimina triloba]